MTSEVFEGSVVEAGIVIRAWDGSRAVSFLV